MPLPIELSGCLTTLADHPDGNKGGAAGTPSVDQFIMGQANYARGNDRYPTWIASAGGSQWSMAMSGPGCSSMDANRQLPVSVSACATGTVIRVVTDIAMTPGSIAVDEMNVVAVVLLSGTSIAPYRDNNGKGRSRPSTTFSLNYGRKHCYVMEGQAPIGHGDAANWRIPESGWISVISSGGG